MYSRKASAANLLPPGPVHGSPRACDRPVGLAASSASWMLAPMDLRRSWPTLGLVALLVLDLVLVVLALAPSSRGSAALAPGSVVTSAADPTSSSTAGPSATTASLADPTTPRPLTRIVVPVGANA